MIHFSLLILLRCPLVFISGLAQGFGTTLIIKECAYINSFSILSLVRKGQRLNIWLIQKGWRLISFLFKIQRGCRVSDLCQSAPTATFKNHYLLDVRITCLETHFDSLVLGKFVNLCFHFNLWKPVLLSYSV